MPYYPNPLPRTDDNLLYRAVAQVAMRIICSRVLRIWLVKPRARPGNAAVDMVLGDALQSSGKPSAAVAAYEQALRLRPDFPRSLLTLAAALKGAGQLPRAEETLKHALAIAPSNPAVWLQYGGIDFAQGRIEAAIAKMEKAIALDPELPAEHTGLAELLLASSARQIAPTRRCKRRCGSILMTAPHTICEAERWPREASWPNRLRISKGPVVSPRLRTASTTTGWRCSECGNRFDEAQASAERPCKPILKWQRRTCCWVAYSPANDNYPRRRRIQRSSPPAARLRSGAPRSGQRACGSRR